MTTDSKLPEWVKSPFTVATSAVAGLWGVLNVDLLAAGGQALVASAPQIFGAVTVGTLTLPEFLPPTSAADWLGVAATVLFGIYTLHKIDSKFDRNGL